MCARVRVFVLLNEFEDQCLKDLKVIYESINVRVRTLYCKILKDYI